jgi:hypothetical protein
VEQKINNIVVYHSAIEKLYTYQTKQHNDTNIEQVFNFDLIYGLTIPFSKYPIYILLKHSILFNPIALKTFL